MLLNKFSCTPYFVINELSVLSPLNVKRFDKITIYISHTQLIHFSYTFKFLSSTLKIRFFFSQIENLRTLNLQHSSMALSSARQETDSSGSGLQINTGSSYVIKPKTMAIPFESFEVQVESPVDFASLKRNGMNLDSLMAAQQLFAYFNMLNGPTYVKLVKDFWVRAEVYDVDAAKVEELQAVARDPNLRGKTRKEMGLEPFRQTEIRSSVMGIPITIIEEVIAKACRVALSGRFLWNVSRKHSLLKIFTTVVLKGNPATKLVDIEGNHRMLLKFMTDCFFQKGGASDQPSVDHKLVLYFLAAFEKINLPRYLMHHLCWAIKEGIRGKRKQIPYGRLLSEIFTQGKLLETLRKNKLASDKALGTVTGKIINGKTLQNMKIIRKFSPNEKDLKESAVQT